MCEGGHKTDVIHLTQNFRCTQQILEHNQLYLRVIEKLFPSSLMHMTDSETGARAVEFSEKDGPPPCYVLGAKLQDVLELLDLGDDHSNYTEDELKKLDRAVLTSRDEDYIEAK